MKQLIALVVAGTFALSSISAVAADAASDTLRTGPAQGETRTERAGDYVEKKAHNAKVKTKRAARKTKSKAKQTIANRKTTDPASVSESRPDATNTR